MDLIQALHFKDRYYLLIEHGIRIYQCKVDADSLDKSFKLAKEHIQRYPVLRQFNITGDS